MITATDIDAIRDRCDLEISGGVELSSHDVRRRAAMFTLCLIATLIVATVGVVGAAILDVLAVVLLSAGLIGVVLTCGAIHWWEYATSACPTCRHATLANPFARHPVWCPACDHLLRKDCVVEQATYFDAGNCLSARDATIKLLAWVLLDCIKNHCEVLAIERKDDHIELRCRDVTGESSEMPPLPTAFAERIHTVLCAIAGMNSSLNVGPQVGTVDIKIADWCVHTTVEMTPAPTGQVIRLLFGKEERLRLIPLESISDVGCVESSERTGMGMLATTVVRSEGSTHPTC